MPVLEEFKKRGLFAEDGPIVGVNANAANPQPSLLSQERSTMRLSDPGSKKPVKSARSSTVRTLRLTYSAC